MVTLLAVTVIAGLPEFRVRSFLRTYFPGVEIVVGTEVMAVCEYPAMVNSDTPATMIEGTNCSFMDMFSFFYCVFAGRNGGF
jgi:hypothetical protein